MPFHFPLNNTLILHHQSCNERQNSVELRESSVDHGVGLYIVTSSDTCDTISTNLTLTDSRKRPRYISIFLP